MACVMRNRLLGLSPQVLERTERIGEKCGESSGNAGWQVHRLGRPETAQRPANKGPNSKTPPRAGCPRERRCIQDNGGGGGNRTRVRKRFHERIYVRSLSFKSSPPARASGALTPVARRLSFLPGQPPASRVGARCRRPLPPAGGHGGDGRPDQAASAKLSLAVIRFPAFYEASGSSARNARFFHPRRNRDAPTGSGQRGISRSSSLLYHVCNRN